MAEGGFPLVRLFLMSAQPLVIRSALTSGDMMALIDEWDLFMAQDKSLYQMGGGRGMQTLSTMWDSPMRLEHDLRDTSTPNPVMAWLSTAPQGSVAARVWHLQQQLEGVAASHTRKVQVSRAQRRLAGVKSEV